MSETTTMRRRRMGRVCSAPALATTFLLATTVLLVAGSVAHADAPAPLVQMGAKLTDAPGTTLPSGEMEGEQEFGRSLALSADGDTALVGAPRNGGEAGAAFVLTLTGSTWNGQAQLTSGEAGVEEGHFGHNVALSADGDTAAISSPTLGGGSGAVWVFARSGSTWTLQAKLTGSGESGTGHFGAGLALSPDGETLAVGAPDDDHSAGAVWIFVRSGATWAQQGEKLIGGGEEDGAGEFGRAVALSGNGEVALVGAPVDRQLAGAAWVFARVGVTWTQLGAALTGGEESGAGHFGDSVALSGDGDTALVGGRQDGGKAGAVWVFARSGVTFLQQGAKLAAAGEESGAGEFGWSVALSADGDTALIGGLRDNAYMGAAWLFTRAGATWTQQGGKLTGAEEQGRGWFGSSVALSADGADALVGGVADDGRAGAVWSFAPPANETPAGSSPSGGDGGASGGGSPGAGTPGAQTQTVTGGQPGSGASPKQGVGAFKAAGGAVVLVGRSFPVRHGRAAIRLRCTAPVACRGRLALALAPRATTHDRRATPITIGGVRFWIPRRHTALVKVALRAAGSAALSRARGPLRARLMIAVFAPTPATRARSYAVRLVRRAVKRS